ncbi:MAG TPA: phage tail terminator-like protein [Pseudomonas sp.]|nr:phage tail terminator-like protein [Pseudomonas sp.]
MSETKINAALVSAVLASGVMPQARIAFEGAKFEPVTGQSWVRIIALPSDRSPAAMGSSAPQEWTGILQIDIYHPLNTGTGPILGDADKALAYFRSGRRLEFQGQRVLVRRAQRSQIRRDDIWQVVSVDVYCTAWIFPA